MLKLLWRLVLLVLAALALVWLADRPGNITIHWQDQDIELTVFVGVMLLAAFVACLLMVIWLLRSIWHAPQVIRGNRKARREKNAYQALSRGIIAAGAGDSVAAARHAAIAGATLKHEPLVKLLGAQAAQLRGDKDEVARVFHGLSQNDETALLGLRGLYAQARDRGDWSTARKHAEAALARHGRLAWAQHAMLISLTREKEWQGAAKMIEQMAKAGNLPKLEANQKQAALLCAAGMAAEENEPATALKLATQAHGLDPALVPAALVMARVYSTQGQPKRALKAIRETWAKFPQRELAMACANVSADSAEDKFERVRELVGKEPASAEGRFALARALIGATRLDAARETLAVDVAANPMAGVCVLMAEIEEASGDATKAKSWLARGLAAPHDPVWMSDGVALAEWSPVSPISGEVVAPEWASPKHRADSHQLSFTASAPETQPSTAPISAALLKPHVPDDPGVE